MTVKLENTKKAEALFYGWQETIIYSCLQGIMGTVYADHSEKPQSAMAFLGDFCFFAGIPNKELVLYQPEDSGRFLIMVPQSEQWAGLIAGSYGGRARRIMRYAIKKEKDIFDKSKLELAAGSLPKGYSLKMIDEELFCRCKAYEWSRDLVSQYGEYQMYKKLGIGVVAMKGQKIVSGASSYSSYKDGVEIEIDTHKDYRRKGLAYACGAKLILACLEKGWYPSWDAHNKASVALAEKLGYHFDHAYTAFEIEK